MLAAFRAEPIPARSVAAVVIISGAAIKFDMMSPSESKLPQELLNRDVDLGEQDRPDQDAQKQRTQHEALKVRERVLYLWGQ